MGLGTKMIRTGLFAANFMVWAASVCFIGFGIFGLVESARLEYIFAEDNLDPVAALVLSLGIFGFLVGFAGCYGTIKDNMCLLKMYFVFMIVIILGEISAGTMLFVYRNDVEPSMAIGMRHSIIYEYGEVVDATNSIDMIQRKFECCGAYDYSDYHNSVFRSKNGLSSLPPSCCTPEEGMCYTYSFQLNTEGCVGASQDFLLDKILILGLICFGFIFIAVFAMVFTCCLIRAVRREIDNLYRPFDA